jgi:hypothetical protein
MKNQARTALYLAYPILVAGLAVVVAFTLSPDGTTKLQFDLFKPFVFERDIANDSISRAIFLGAAAGFAAIPAFRNYSSFYPTLLGMSVFFDEKGIEKALAQFTQLELGELSVDRNWREGQRQFIHYLNTVMEDYGLDVFGPINPHTHGLGEIVFRVKSIAGWQKYQVTEARGHVRTHLTKKSGEHVILELIVELKPTQDDLFSGRLREIYFQFTKVIRPVFSLYLHAGPISREHVGDLVAVTKIRFFPVVDVGRTVYMLVHSREDQIGSLQGLVPVAYAIYDPE